MLSYHNDPEIKQRHIEMAERHVEQDMLRAGTYGADRGGFKACSIGCFAHEIDPTKDDYHAVVAEAAGWPLWLAHLNDTLFEGLPPGERESFHVDLRRAVPVGVDLEPVRHRLAICRMDRLIEAQSGDGVSALTAVRACHKAALGGLEPDWAAALSAAQSAARLVALSARSAAWSAATLSAESAAWSAAESASAESAESAESAAQSAAPAARADAYRQERNALLRLLAVARP